MKDAVAIRSCFSLKKIILLEEPSGLPDARIALFHRESTTNDFFPLYPANETDPAFIVFTSGSTGFPKAVVHTHRCAESILRSMQNVLQVRNDDIYWCTAHPAWITGTVYGVIGPLIAGVESVQYSGNFHARRWMPILQNQKYLFGIRRRPLFVL
jgi:acetyl-CoA synthetase